MGLLGTGGAYIISYYIVEHLVAIAASSVTFIPPVVALLTRSLLVGEPIDPMDYLATILILVGVVLLRRNE